VERHFVAMLDKPRRAEYQRFFNKSFGSIKKNLWRMGKLCRRSVRFGGKKHDTRLATTSAFLNYAFPTVVCSNFEYNPA